ncbi:hypothetical protein HDU93_007588, partial [Gonapodya sp. JEL0774]
MRELDDTQLSRYLTLFKDASVINDANGRDQSNEEDSKSDAQSVTTESEHESAVSEGEKRHLENDQKRMSKDARSYRDGHGSDTSEEIPESDDEEMSEASLDSTHSGSSKSSSIASE